MLEYEWGNAAPMIFTGDETNNPITTAATTTTHHHHHSDLDHTGRYFFDPFSTSNPNFNDPNPTHNTTLPPSSSSTSSSSSPYSSHYNTTGFYNQHHQNTHPPPPQFHSFPDPRLNFYPNTNPNLPLTPPMLSLETLTAVSTPQLHHQAAGGTNYMNMMLPKQEPCTVMDYSSTTSNNNNSSSANNNNNNNNRIGLNLGGRTYFSAADDHDFVDRLYRRGSGNGRGGGAGGGYGGGGGLVGNSARCQAEGCNADLTHSKHYHRRHKVCEFHSKASTVIAAGLTQRFCQQCSRFHLLTEFDNGKRSCRRRLADHNRRRRKSNQMVSQDSRIPQADQNSRSKSSSETPQRSPSDSGIHSSSSVTVAVSPPRMSLDCPFKPSRPPAPPPPPSYNVLMTGNAATSAATNSASSTSLFYP